MTSFRWGAVDVESLDGVSDFVEHKSCLDFFFGEEWDWIEAGSHVDEVDPAEMVGDDNRSGRFLGVIELLNEVETDIIFIHFSLCFIVFYFPKTG